MSKLSDYLAKNYLTADPAPDSKRKSGSGKKRKRKGTANGDAAGGVVTATSGLVIADDDVLDWGDANGKKASKDEDGLLDGMITSLTLPTSPCRDRKSTSTSSNTSSPPGREFVLVNL